MHKLLNILKQYIKNYLVIRKFLKEKRNCKVIFFSIPSSEFIAYLSYDIIQTVSKKVHQYQQNPNDYDRKRIIKLAWLTTQEKFHNPIQLLKSDIGYFCHPGTDRVVSMTYLNPTNTVEGIYLWYPEQDPSPIHLLYEHKELTSPFEMLSKFKLSDTLRFKAVDMNPNLDVSDAKTEEETSNAMFYTTKKYFNKASDKFDYHFLSWYDNMQWQEIKSNNEEMLISFKDNTCNFGNSVLQLKNGMWIKK
jgi:hypothetical protein